MENKKYIKVVLGLSLVLGSYIGLLAQDNNVSKQLSIDTIKNMPIIRASHVQIIGWKKIDNNWFMIQGTRNTTFFTNGDTVIVGRGFESKTGKSLSIDIDYSKYKKDAAYTLGKGGKDFYLFTDLECPFCKMMDPVISKLQDKNISLHVYFYPLSFHLASPGFTLYVLSLPENQRQKAVEKIMNNSLSNNIKLTEKYQQSLFSLLANSDENNKRLSEYKLGVMNAYDINASEVSSFCKKKLKEIGKDVKNKEVFEKMKYIGDVFNVEGTPSFFDQNGKSVKAEVLFDSYGVVNFKPIKEIVKRGLSIDGGSGTADLYIITSTQCPHCIDMFKNNKKAIEKLLKKYKLHFILMPTGTDSQRAFEDIKKLLSIKDSKKRFEVFKNVMMGEKIKDINVSKETEREVINYLRRDLRESFVSSTPTIIDDSGKVIDMRKLLK